MKNEKYFFYFLFIIFKMGKGMSGWLIALLVILVVFIIVMIVLAIVSSTSSNNNGNTDGMNGINPMLPINGTNANGQQQNMIFIKKDKHEDQSGSGSNSGSGNESSSNVQSCRNIDILYASISLATGEFIQNAKNSSKRVGNSFKNMNKHAVAIGEVIQNVHKKHGDEYANCLLQKNQIYKNLVEYIIVKRQTLNPNDHLLHGLNDVNEKMGKLLVKMNDNIKFEDYVVVLHKYDVLVVQQIHHVNEGNADEADRCNQEAQVMLITISSNTCR